MSWRRHGSWALMAIGVVLAAAAALGCAGDPCAEGLPGTVCPVAGTGQLGFNRDGKPPGETDLFLVSRARRGPDGLLYLVDFNNWRIRRIGEDGLVETVAGNGVHGFAFPGVPALESPLDNPTDAAFAPDGRLVITSIEDPRVLAIDDGIIEVVAGTGEHGDEGDGGPATQARFLALDGLAIAPDNAIYVSDSQANRIRVIRDGLIDTVAGTGAAGYAGDGGPALDARFDHPSALALAADGSLYVADSLNHVVRRITPDGLIETVAGTGTPGLSGDGGPALHAELNEPYGLAVTDDGSLYIADRANFRIRRVTPDGLIHTLAGTDEGHTGDGGPAREARFSHLARLTLDGNSLLIADQGNSCIRRIHLAP